MAYIYLSGKIAWAHLFEPDEFNGVKKWKLNFYPDAKSFETIKEAGIKRHIKNDEMGRYIKLDRGTFIETKKGRQELDAPRVIDISGEPWDSNKLIGNGSEVTVQVEVYDSKFGKGSRLEGVRIDKLVEYEGNGGNQLATINVREMGEDVIPF